MNLKALLIYEKLLSIRRVDDWAKVTAFGIKGWKGRSKILGVILGNWNQDCQGFIKSGIQGLRDELQ